MKVKRKVKKAVDAETMEARLSVLEGDLDALEAKAATAKGATAKEVKELQRQAAELLARVTLLESRQDRMVERLEKVEAKVLPGFDPGGLPSLAKERGEPSPVELTTTDADGKAASIKEGDIVTHVSFNGVAARVQKVDGQTAHVPLPNYLGTTGEFPLSELKRCGADKRWNVCELGSDADVRNPRGGETGQ